mgnify:CR=1 FL=1
MSNGNTAEPRRSRLIQEGRATDEEWADCFGEEPRTFRKKLQEYGIRCKKWGRFLIVDAEDLYNGMPDEIPPRPE